MLSLLVRILKRFEAWNSACHNIEGETKAWEKVSEIY